MKSQRASSIRRLSLAFLLLYPGIILLILPALYPFYSFRLVDLTDGIGTALVTASFVLFIINRRFAVGEASSALQLARHGILRLDYPSDSVEQFQIIERIQKAISNAAVVRIAANYRIVQQLEVLESFSPRSGQDLALLLSEPGATQDASGVSINRARFTLGDIGRNLTSRSGSRIKIRVSLKPISQTMIITDESAFLLVPIGRSESFRDRFILIEGDRRSEIRESSLDLFEEQWSLAETIDLSEEQG